MTRRMVAPGKSGEGVRQARFWLPAAGVLACAVLAAGCVSAPLPPANTKEILKKLEASQKAPAPATVPATLTLLKAKEITLAQNPSLAIAAARVRQAANTFLQVRGTQWPGLAANASATHYDVSPNSAATPLDGYEQYGASLGVSWLVFDGFQRHLATLAAEHGQQAAVAAHADAQRVLLNALASAYFSVLQAQQEAAIAASDADFNAKLLDDVLKRRKYDKASRGEELNFRVRLNNAKVRQITATGGCRLARIALAQLMGLPNAALASDVQLSIETPSEAQSDLALLLARALSQRPDLKSVREQAEAARRQAQAKGRTFYPKVSVFANQEATRTDSANLAHEYWGWNTGATATIDLWDAGQRYHAWKAAKADADAAASELERLQLAVVAELRQGVESLQTARAALQLQEESTTLTQEARDLEEKRYQAGETTLTRLNEVQNDLVAAQSGLASRRIEVLKTQETLLALTGDNLPASAVPVAKPVPAGAAAPAAPAAKK